jgi:hypothetical protein
VRIFVPEGLSESSPVRSAGLAFLESYPSRKDGTIDEYLQSLSRVQDQKPSISIVPHAHGTDLFFASFPSTSYWDAEQEKGELLRGMYPTGVAERVRSGAELTAETVPNVTVAFVLIDGLDLLAAKHGAAEVLTILQALLDALNSAAASHGVEPVRSLGESYIGVCGLSSPRLDHATRTLAWARAATLALQRPQESRKSRSDEIQPVARLAD